MGMIIPVQRFSKDNTDGLLKPIIYCCPYEDSAVSLNLLLAEKLASCRSARRTMQLESFFNQILSQLPDDVVIKDYDVMFNPDYKVDVLRILTSARKRKAFSVIWLGRYEDGKLFYAEEGCPDFKVFNIDEYDVTCII